VEISFERKTSNQDFRISKIKEFYNQEAFITHQQHSLNTQTLTYSIKIRIQKKSFPQTNKQMGKKAPGDRWCAGPASASIIPGDARFEIAHHRKWSRKMQGLACPLGYTPIHTHPSWMGAQIEVNRCKFQFIIIISLSLIIFTQKRKDKGSGDGEERVKFTAPVYDKLYKIAHFYSKYEIFPWLLWKCYCKNQSLTTNILKWKTLSLRK